MFNIFKAASKCAGAEVGSAAIESAKEVIEAAFSWPGAIWLIGAIGQVPLAGNGRDVTVLF